MITMGAKGRDVVFWLFVLFITGAALSTSKLLYWAALVCAWGLAAYHWYTLQAIKHSRAMGLRTVVLLPLWPGFAAVYRLMAGRQISGKWRRAYEIHIKGASSKNFLKQLETDLVLINSTMAGLFFWETSAPVPAVIRRLIREKKRQGKAFWVKGAWPAPRAPGTGREIVKKHVRHGAIFLD
ncbi:MAG: hypothetical protein A4E53_00070 [Pelotomaculum sp. PtaB.Bin104]|nr:MAG: hypothetical protein A4E53_00070 [Pelotomaculum sp. PtaB.Bin104]